VRIIKYWIYILVASSALYSQIQGQINLRHKLYVSLKYIYSNPYDTDHELKDSVILQRNRWFIGPHYLSQQTSGIEAACGYNVLNFLTLELGGSLVPNYKGLFRITDVQNDYHQQDYTYDLYNFFVNAVLITDLIPSVEGYFKVGAGLSLRERNVRGSIRISMVIINDFRNYSDSFAAFSYKLGYGLRWWVFSGAPLIIEFYNFKGTQKLADIRNWNLLLGLNYLL